MSLEWAWGWEIDADDADYDNWVVIPGIFGLQTDWAASAQPGGGVGGGSRSLVLGRAADIETPEVISDTTMSVGFWFQVLAGDEFRANAGSLMAIRDASGQALASIKPSVPGTSSAMELTVYKSGVDYELIGTSSTSLSVGTWYWIAVKFDATGAVDATLYIDGVEEVQGQASGGGPYTAAKLFFNGVVDGGDACLVDSVVVYNSLSDAVETEHFIQGLRPNADAEEGNFNPSTGPNSYGVVNDGSSSDYTESTSGPDEIRFGLESRVDIDAGWDPPTVVGLHGIAMCRGDTGDGNALIRHSASTESGDNFSLSTSPVMASVTANQNPSTSSPWTSDDIDTAVGGYAASSFANTQLDGLVVEVVWNELVVASSMTADFVIRRASI